jgi:uncharacterized membrane protein HdeD (DUF308 family)
MKEIIKKKELKGIFVSLLLIVLGVFLIIKPLEIVKTLIQIMGIILLLSGCIDFMNYFRMSEEEKLFNYGLFKGIMELCIGILFIFKFEVLTSIFSIIIGLTIIFINIFKLQLSINLKQIENTNWLVGVIISTISIILGIIIILDPFDSVKLLIISSGIIICISELANIIYSFLIISQIKTIDKVVKDIIKTE